MYKANLINIAFLLIFGLLLLPFRDRVKFNTTDKIEKLFKT